MTHAEQLKQAQQKNAELTAQLALREQLSLSLVKDFSVEKADLERECERLGQQLGHQLSAGGAER